MAGTIPDASELTVLNLILGTKVSTGARVKLYKNNKDPKTIAAPNELVEANFAGYAPIGPANLWDTIATDVNGKARARSKALQFTTNADAQNQNIYGYYVELNIDGVWTYWGGEKFPAPRLVNNTGDFVPVIVDLTVCEDPLP